MKKDTENNNRLSLGGSLTIEAALVMPMFLFMMICVISLSTLILFQLRLKECLHEEVKTIAMKSLTEGYPEEGEITSHILAGVGENILKIAPIKGGSSGISIRKTITDDEVVTIFASYQASLYYDLFNLFNREFTQSCVQHNWEGYERGFTEQIRNKEEEYVYITNDSDVYHTSAECTHIHLKITPIIPEELSKARNADGSKYKSCEHCHSKPTDGTLYITPEGDKYHNSLSCSGLKRTVISVPKSEVEGKRPCSRCGK